MDNQNNISTDIDIRDAFFDEVYCIASKDPDVIFLTADMGALSLNKFKKDLPTQFINVGVAEQNLISIAAGLTLGGKRPFIYGIASFVVQRCYEQIKVDLCAMNLPVTLIGSGPGITYSSDGPTHHTIGDIAIMRALPGMTIFNPSDSFTAVASAQLSYKSNGPVYVRIDKGRLPNLHGSKEDFSQGMSILKEGRDIMIITTGTMVHQAFSVATQLARHSIDAGVIDLYKIKPINEELLLASIERVTAVVTMEEHSIIGGIGSAVSEILANKGKLLFVKHIGIPDKYCVGYGDKDWMYCFYKLNTDTVVNTILNWHQITVVPKKKDGDLSKKNKCLELKCEDFSRLFGTTTDDLAEDCKELISQSDFRYQLLADDEHNEVILDISKKIDSDNLSTVGKERKNVWEQGWAENLQNFIEKGHKLEELIPKYYRPGQVMRLGRRFIKGCDPKFEYNFFKVLRAWLYRKYVKDATSVYEFGCGPGHNLVALAEMFPDKEIHGLDWTKAARDLINKISQVYNYNITAHLFDMFFPDKSLRFSEQSIVITFGALEQLGRNYEKFLKFLLKKSPMLCIHVEPFHELYDENELLDYFASKYQAKRNYLMNYLDRLRELENKNKIRILKEQRMFFGNVYYNGWSFVVWSPVKNEV